MSVREEERRKNSCPSRGLGLAAAAIGVGVGAALYYFLNKRQENPDTEGSTSGNWSCEEPQTLDITDSSGKSEYTRLFDLTTTDTSIGVTDFNDRHVMQLIKNSNFQNITRTMATQQKDDCDSFLFDNNEEDSNNEAIASGIESNTSQESVTSEPDSKEDTDSVNSNENSEVSEMEASQDSSQDSSESSQDIESLEDSIEAEQESDFDPFGEEEEEQSDFDPFAEEEVEEGSEFDPFGEEEAEEESDFDSFGEEQEDEGEPDLSNSEWEYGDLAENDNPNIDEGMDWSGEESNLELDSDSSSELDNVRRELFPAMLNETFSLAFTMMFRNSTPHQSRSGTSNKSTEDKAMRILREKAFRERRWSLEECSICFEVMLKDQPLMQLPCAHNFHVACIGPWLQERQTCPMCRKAAE